jgi:SAM-dependent MidA family methyltransferase
MTRLEELIRREIQPAGCISFARFMELALYCPELGYYERADQPIGKQADYYTSVSVGPLFGELLAFQFADWLEAVPDRAGQIVEAGAHDGALAADILGWLRVRRPALLQGLEYWIVEPSQRRQTWQRTRLENFAGSVRWFKSIEALPKGVNGVIFSNELLDAMPVRRFVWDKATARWLEQGVGWDGGRFVWCRLPSEVPDLPAALIDGGLVLPPEVLEALPDRFTVDLSPAAAAWWRRAAETLRAGQLLTFDYGLTAEQLIAPERRQGTLRAYFRHRVASNPLANVGAQDLTAHVNFTQLQRAGEAAGLKTGGLAPQAQFLTEIAKRTWAPGAKFGEWTGARVRQFQTLTHPEHLGRAFRVLLQRRPRRGQT